MKTSILIPSMHRPELLRRAIQSVIDTTQGFDVEIVCVIDEDLESLRQVFELAPHKPKMPENISDVKTAWWNLESFQVQFNKDRIGGIAAWNRAAELSSGDILFPFGDDGLCHPDWLKIALAAHQEKLGGYGCVGINDLHRPDGSFVTTFLYDRKWVIDNLGGVVAMPCYGYYCVDNEIFDIAKRSGKFYYEPAAIVEHMHPSVGKREADASDRSRDGHWNHDVDLFQQRKSQGFPVTWEPVLK